MRWLLMKKIKLTQGQYTLVDNEDYDWLNQWKWCFDGKRYAVRTQRIGLRKNNKQVWFRMHRVLLKIPKGYEIDHINRDTLDNRRSNLRMATIQQNKCNTSIRSDNTTGFKGVSWNGRRWRSNIQSNKRQYHLGNFLTKEEAALAYNQAAINLHKEYAYLNQV